MCGASKNGRKSPLFFWPEKITRIKLEDGQKIDKNVWICILTELENGAAHSNRDLLTRFGCTPTNEPLWEIPKKTSYIVGMKMEYNPQENPQIYLVISTHLNNMLIKLHHFSKISWGKKQKMKSAITWTLDASCYSKHQWVGTCFGMTNSFWSRPKMPYVNGVSASVFFHGGLWCLQNDILGISNMRSMLDLVSQSSGTWKKIDPKHHLKWKLVIKEIANYLLCWGDIICSCHNYGILKMGVSNQRESLIFPMGFLCFPNTPDEAFNMRFHLPKTLPGGRAPKQRPSLPASVVSGRVNLRDFSTDTPFT